MRLSDTFREDLAELPAEDIVDFYGTHVLADIRMGGRVSFLYKTYAGKENVEAITKAGFKVDVLNLFSIGNEYQVNTSLAVNIPGSSLRSMSPVAQMRCWKLSTL